MRTSNEIKTSAHLSAKLRHPGTTWLSDRGSRGAGRLVAKTGEGRAIFYFAYFDTEGARRFLQIGPFDSNGTRGVTLARARDRAAELSAMHRNGTPNLHEHLEREQEAKDRAHRAAKEAEQSAQAAAKRGTLRQVLEAYTAHLEKRRKQSAGDVRRIFARHVLESAPDMAARRAADIPVDDFRGLLSKLVKAEKGRTAAKLRSYMRAAFMHVLDDDELRPSFGLAVNPVASINGKKYSAFNRARRRNLSGDELRAFLQHLEKVPAGVTKDAVLLALLLGGQRPAQLLRARPVDVDLSAGTITMFDGKGSRKQPRVHTIPLTKQAGAIVQALLERGDEDKAQAFVFSTDGGKTHLRPETAAAVVTEISKAMVKAKQSPEPFQMRDLRRTCETTLASLKVSSDVRAQLQSHGLGGIQARHYDMHEYMTEKREALELWQRHLEHLLTGKTAKVVPMKRAGARA